MNDQKVYQMPFARVYPLYIAKAERKDRTKQEVDQIITWLTGYTKVNLKNIVDSSMSFDEFFAQAPNMNPNRRKITGLICGIRVEDIKEPLMQEIRYLDKLIDELAKGKTMDKILRSS